VYKSIQRNKNEKKHVVILICPSSRILVNVVTKLAVIFVTSSKTGQTGKNDYSYWMYTFCTAACKFLVIV